MEKFSGDFTESFGLSDVKSDEADTKIKINFNFSENKFIYYFALFYSFGLFIGSYFYKIAKTDELNNIISLKDSSFANLFLENLLYSMIIFLFVVFLGFNIIGNFLTNIFPLIAGTALGIRLGYYYTNFNVNGVGYSLLMIIPYAVVFLTVLAFTLKVSNELSDEIKSRIKGESCELYSHKPYLIKYSLLGIIVILSSFIQAGVIKLFYNVVTI